MQALLRMIKIRTLVVHDIPTKLSKKVLHEDPNHTRPQPLFSQIPSPMNKDIEDYITLKINNSLGSTNAMDIKFEEGSPSPVPKFIEDHLKKDKNNKVKITQSIAQHLFDKQNATNSNGLLLFVECDLGQKNALIIMKVEREEGLRITEESEREKFVTFSVQHINDLLLTKKTKLFKIAMFYYRDQNIVGSICDNQTGYYEQRDTAEFFLNDFLGCEFYNSSKASTRDFYEASVKYINEKISSPLEKGNAITQLVAEMTNRQLVFNVKEFSRKVFSASNVDDYLQYLKNCDVRTQSFQKDTELIFSKLNRIQYSFKSGIIVYGEKKALDSKTKIKDSEDGTAIFEIRDSLSKVQTK